MRPTPPIRVLVATLGVAPVFLLAITLVALLASSTREISERLGTSLVDNATSQVRADVSSFLADAVRLSDLYTRRAQGGILPTTGLEPWERPQFDDLMVNPGVASISFGGVNGETTWLLRHAERLELGRVGLDTVAQEFLVHSATGAPDAVPLRTYSYDPRERPWYKAAIDADAPVWTPVYFWFGSAGSDSEAGTGYTRPLRRPDGSLAGVLVVDVTLGGLSDFLKSLSFSSSGSIFIVDGRDLLVAASHGAVNSASGERLPLAASEQPAARAVAAALARGAGARAVGDMLRIDLDSGPVRVRITPLKPYPGIDWSIIAVIPEAAFLSDARSLQRRAMMLSTAAVAGSIVLALALASHLSRPLMAVVRHVRGIGKGDFDTRLELHSARELRDLSDELNRMAVSLKDHMELRHSLELAMQVQQHLLPSGPPRAVGLDIAGQSRYCDATGGDYYDFIEVSELPGGRVLIAVGDVMGHGIAAALLMATARAALRAHAGQPGSLGELMERVNSVLARGASHGRFMTMILVVMDPVERTLRWASAGHDPPIIFDEGRFLDLEGGDLPLGVMEDTRYEEYTISGLNPGAVVLIGTDGIWEAANAANELFGKDRLRALIRDAGSVSSADIMSGVEGELADFCAGCPVQDDVTMVVLRLESPAGGDARPVDEHR